MLASGMKKNDIKNKNSLYDIVKRLMDIILSIIGIIVSVPIIIIFGILIMIESKGFFIYSQKRVGKEGKIFTIYKMRSMYIDAENIGEMWAEKDDIRVTKIGRFIRKTRIDELPQFFNILLGDMSVVGPRPERPAFVEKFNKEVPGFGKRLKVKCGLTGWAQVNGGYDLTPEQKLDLDIYYINNKSILLDIKILLMTVKTVITGRGAR